MDKIIIADVERCLACKACEIACALEHSTSKRLEEAIKESPGPQQRVRVEAADAFAVPMQCRHCEDAPCVDICPTHALRREQAGDPVILDADHCIGCSCCLIVCPFGVIAPSRDGRVVVKCDLCMARLARGELPACVESCPTGALRFCSVGDYLEERRQNAARQTCEAVSGASEVLSEPKDGRAGR